MSEDLNWSLSEGFLTWLKKSVPAGSTVLELGSGTGSIEMAKTFTVHTVEHDPIWLNKSETVNYIYAPLAKHKPVGGFDHFQWYDKTILEPAISKLKYDVLIIDGPPGCVGRSGFLKYIDIFDTSALIVMDDVHRAIEMKLAKKISARIKRPFTVMDCWADKHWAYFLRGK